MTHPILGNYDINSTKLEGNSMYQVSLSSDACGSFFGYGDTMDEAIEQCMNRVLEFINNYYNDN